MIEELLPPGVRSAEAFDDSVEAPLLPGESEAVSGATQRRRREYATVRRCARAALAELGVGPTALVPDAYGAPRWPQAIVGSMTHCPGYRAAAVAPSDLVRAVGVDAEPDEPLPAVIDQIADAAERRHIEDLRTRADPVHWDRLLFCCKEAVYKAWFPLTGRWLGFHDAVVTIDPDRNTFRARLRPSRPARTDDEPAVFSGRWLARDGLLLAAIADDPV
ncbi:4'-phosphopantetheinyl transferase superfamily protein [Streptomyces sp. NBC_01166]|uniref:4'-phosphopantetheinyl transferase family protein n=1 Tax=Streptomyces sp. NBC_01166 TaxID=2903755 RepID=UPI003866C9D3|nr:4'-phosphopantetheinyl transferase superfamily protein [Streptomyces sp. NBC_01166]